MSPYSYRVFWSEEDGGYVAACIELPGVSAFGETPAEAMAEAEVATDLAIETYRDEGLPVPAPQPAPQHSGQFRLRMPRTLHRELAMRAADEGVSLNQIAVVYIAAGLGESRALKHLRDSHRAMVGAAHGLASVFASGSTATATSKGHPEIAHIGSGATSLTTSRIHRIDA
jgi:predicted RNase H-like HicB family nuclease